MRLDFERPLYRRRWDVHEFAQSEEPNPFTGADRNFDRDPFTLHSKRLEMEEYTMALMETFFEESK
jgi:hypothetical protein